MYDILNLQVNIKTGRGAEANYSHLKITKLKMRMFKPVKILFTGILLSQES
jgi:hypothetical protein